MKQVFFKYACIFIILIFCLMPLGAIDLEDNNTKYINQDDNESGIAEDDANLTADNQSELNGSSEFNGSEKTVGNNTENLSEYPDWEYEPITITVDDIYEGESAFMEVRTADFINDGVWICANGQYNWVWMRNGYACTTIDGLKAGTYTAEVYIQQSPVYNKTTFTVKPRINPISSVEVEDILAGQRAVAEVHTDKSYIGEITLALDDSTETKTIKIENGYGKTIFDEDLLAGNHTVEARSTASREFKAGTKSTTFKVNNKCALDVQVDDIYEGDPIVAKVNTTKNYNGLVIFSLDDSDAICEYAKDGHLTHTFNSENLRVGTHEVYVVIMGGGIFDSWENDKTVEFQVKERA